MLRGHTYISVSSDIYKNETISPNALMCRISRTGDVTRPLVCYHEPTYRSYRWDDVTTIQSIASSVVITRLRRHPIVDHNLISNLESCCSSPATIDRDRVVLRRSWRVVLISPGSCRRLCQIMSLLPVASYCGPSVKCLWNKNDTSGKRFKFSCKIRT